MTQVIGGSLETDPVNGINVIAGVVDEWQELAKDLEPMQRLRVAEALGHIASNALIAYELLQNDSEESPLEYAPELSVVREPIDGIEPTAPEAPEQSAFTEQITENTDVVTPVSAIESEGELGTESNIETDNVQQLVDYFSAVSFSSRELQLLQRLCQQSGQKIKAADLYSTLEGTPSALKQATSKFIRKLKDSPYSEYLEVTGTKGGTRYFWSGHGFEFSDVPSGDLPHAGLQNVETLVDGMEIQIDRSDDSDPIEVGSITTERSEEVKADYTGYGFDALKADSRDLFVKGVYVHLTPLSNDIVHAIVESGGTVRFKDLLKSSELQQYASRPNFSRDLNEALVEIHRVLKGHDIPWSDYKIPENGKNVRIAQLGDRVSADAEATDHSFLSNRV